MNRHVGRRVNGDANISPRRCHLTSLMSWWSRWSRIVGEDKVAMTNLFSLATRSPRFGGLILRAHMKEHSSVVFTFLHLIPIIDNLLIILKLLLGIIELIVSRKFLSTVEIFLESRFFTSTTTVDIDVPTPHRFSLSFVSRPFRSRLIRSMIRVSTSSKSISFFRL